MSTSGIKHFDVYMAMTKMFIREREFESFMDTHCRRKVDEEYYAIEIAKYKQSAEAAALDFIKIAKQLTPAEIIRGIYHVLRDDADKELKKARAKSNDWRTTSRQLGVADGIDSAIWYLTILLDSFNEI